MLHKTKNKILKSVPVKKVPSRFLFHSHTKDDDTMGDDDCSNGCCGDPMDEGISVLSCDVLGHDDVLDRDILGGNASIPYATIQSSGPPSRPLEFPAPTVDRAITVSADVINHRTGNIFLATSVLMRRPIHAKMCASRAPPPPASNSSASFDSTTRSLGHYRTATPDRIQSWHSAFNAPSSSLAPGIPKEQQQKQQHHRRVHSASSKTQKLPPCDPACDLPDKAYCIRKKICNTTYGSIRLCVVLKRVKQNIIPEENGFHSLPNGRIRDVEQRVPTWETTDEMVAIKVVNWSKLQSLRGRHLEDPIKEVSALQQLIGKSHPNIISISDALQNESHLFCVYPYVAGGDLCGCLLDNMASSPTGRMEEPLARTWFRQILSAVNYLQKKGICHRDLCLENMMVDQENNICIIDFGLCLRVPFADPSNRKFVTDVSANTSRRLMKAQGQCGKLEYMAPEVSLRAESFDGFAIDLWAVGIVLFELLVGKQPFTMPDPVDKNFQIISVEGNLAWLLQAKGIEVNSGAVDLLQGMLWCDPAKRWTLSQIVNHPWVQGKGKKIVSPVEEDGMDSRWFINNQSIDEMDDTKSANLFLNGLLNSYSTMNDGDASTSVSSDAVSSDVASQYQLSQSSTDHPSHQSPRQTPPAESRGEPGLDTLNEINSQKKRNWLALSLKQMKWRCTGE